MEAEAFMGALAVFIQGLEDSIRASTRVSSVSIPVLTRSFLAGDSSFIAGSSAMAFSSTDGGDLRS